MACLIKRNWGWQGIVRVKSHPAIIKSFKKHDDAKRWAIETELKLRRENAGIAKIKYPLFRDAALRYINEVSIDKKCYRIERNIINSILQETFAEYPINRVTPSIISKFRDKFKDVVRGNTLNRKLDVVSTMFTTWRKEWGFPVDNPVLSIRRPKNSEPRDRRFTDEEINLLLRGNRTTEQMRMIINLALETGMRPSEMLRIHPEHIKGQTLFIPVAKSRPRTIPLTPTAQRILKSCTLPFNVGLDRLGKRFRRLCKHYGIKDAHLYDIRHQSLTNFMLNKKLDVGSTMLIAGHKDPRMLLRVYNNLKVADVAKKLKVEEP